MIGVNLSKIVWPMHVVFENISTKSKGKCNLLLIFVIQMSGQDQCFWSILSNSLLTVDTYNALH